MPRTQTAASLLLAGLLVMIAVVAGVGPATAASDDTDSDDWSFTERYVEPVLGALDRLQYEATSRVLSDDTTGADDAEAVQSYLNDNSAGFVELANREANASTDRDVLAATFDRNGEDATIYLVATVANDSYTGLKVVDSTDRSVDREVTLTDYAAKNAKNELAYVHDTYIKTGEQIDDSYVRRLAGKYWGDVDAPWLNGSGA